MIKTVAGQIEGIPCAKYAKGTFTLTCKTVNGYYCVTFHNGRQSASTKYSNDKDEMNEYIKSKIRDGYRRLY